MKTLRRLFAVLILCICVSMSSACKGSVPTNLIIRDATISANSTATSLETMQGVALIVYRLEQELAIQAAVNMHESKEQAKARVTLVRTAWIPVWEAFAAARATYAALTAILSAVPQPSDAAIQSAVNGNDAATAKAISLLSSARKRVEGGTQ